MSDRYRQGLKHDIRAKLEKGKAFDQVQVDAVLEDAQKRHYGVDVIAIRNADKLAQCYIIPAGDGQKYIDQAKHRCIEILTHFTQYTKDDFNFKFYIREKDKWVEYNAGN